MGLLVTKGCIVERSARKPGRLVHPTVEETLAHLRRRPDTPDPTGLSELHTPGDPDA